MIIDWFEIPLTKEEEDSAIFIYSQLLKISVLYDRLNASAYFKVFKSYRCTAQMELTPYQSKLATAFFNTPVDGRDIAGMLHRKILEQCNKFNSKVYFAPYTSMVRPTGIGKSYSIRLLAQQAVLW